MEPQREALDQDVPSRQTLRAGDLLSHPPPPAAGQARAVPQKQSWPLARGKGLLLGFLSVLLIGALVVGVVLKLQTPQVPTGRVKWTYAIGTIWKSFPVVSNGMVYIGNQNNRVYALRAASGQVVWSTWLGGHYADSGVINPAPTVSDGIVYVNAQDSFFSALDARTGRTLWSYQVMLGARTAPAVAQEVVYIGSGDGVLSALDARSGRKLWADQIADDDFLLASPVVANGLVYVGTERGVYAFEALSGRRLWAGAATADYTPAVANGVVYVTTIRGEIEALDARSGAVQWDADQPRGFTSGPVVMGETIYVNSYAGVLALNRTNGNERWLYQMPGTLIGLTVVNGTVYVGSGVAATLNQGGISFQPDDKLYALDAASGKEQWFCQLGGAVLSTPAVSNGVVYVGVWDEGTDDGTLYALLPPG